MATFGKTRWGTVLAGSLGALVLLLVPRLSFGQRRSPVVKATIALATDAVHPGSKARVAVIAEIAPGYHINAHHPSFSYLIPTQVQFGRKKNFTVDQVFYPKGKLQKFAFAENGLSVYQGQLVIPALLHVASGTATGEYRLEGQVSYQACNSNACFPPANAMFSLPVRVVGQSVPLKASNSQVFGK